MENRLSDDILAFVRENAAMLYAICNNRGHATISLEVRDGLVAEGSVEVKFRRDKTKGMQAIYPSSPDAH